MGFQREKGGICMMDQNQVLKRELKSRHIFMIALGGVIGTGLFLGSGYTIHEAGPGGAIVAYLVGGICYVFNDALSRRISCCDA